MFPSEASLRQVDGLTESSSCACPAVIAGAGQQSTGAADVPERGASTPGADARAYLDHEVQYEGAEGSERLMDAEGKAVMMQ